MARQKKIPMALNFREMARQYKVRVKIIEELFNKFVREGGDPNRYSSETLFDFMLWMSHNKSKGINESHTTN